MSRQEIIGKKLSELYGLGDNIQNDSYFLVRRGNVSYKVSYQVFLDQLYENILPLLHLSSMAFRDREEYATSNHLHDYTYVQISANPLLSNETPFLSCVTYNSKMLSTVTVLKQKMDIGPEIVEPYIGELNFIYNKNLPSKQAILNSIDNGTFDGWVYPDGTRYPRYRGKYDFTEAYNMYKGSGNQFTVPTINNFLRMNGEQPERGLEYNTYQNFVGNHTHTIQTNAEQGLVLNKDVQATVTLSGGTDWGKTKYGFHLSFGGKKSNLAEIKSNDVTFTQAQLAEKGVKVSSSSTGYSIATNGQNGNRETFPIHYNVPVMIYIGVKKR